MATDPTQPVEPSIEQLVAAFAGAALQFAGPEGMAISTLIPAAEQLVDMFRNHGATNYTVDDFDAIVAANDAKLRRIAADIDAQGGKTPT